MSSCAINSAETILAVYYWNNACLTVYDTLVWRPRFNRPVSSSRYPQGLCFAGNQNNVLLCVENSIQEFVIDADTFEITPLRSIPYSFYGSVGIFCNGQQIALSAQKTLKVLSYETGSSIWHRKMTFCSSHGLLIRGNSLLVTETVSDTPNTVHVLDLSTGASQTQFSTLSNPFCILQTGEFVLLVSRNGDSWLHDCNGLVLCKSHTSFYDGPVFIARDKVWCISNERKKLFSPSVLNWHLGKKRVFIQVCLK